MGFKNYFCFHINTTLYFPISLIKRTFSNHKMKPHSPTFLSTFLLKQCRYDVICFRLIVLQHSIGRSTVWRNWTANTSNRSSKKNQMAKSSRFTEKKLWNTVQIEKRQETRDTKREIRRPTWKLGPNQPWIFQTRNTTETNNIIAAGKYHLISPSK